MLNFVNSVDTDQLGQQEQLNRDLLAWIYPDFENSVDSDQMVQQEHLNLDLSAWIYPDFENGVNSDQEEKINSRPNLDIFLLSLDIA